MSEIPPTHPRAVSLRIRERLIEGFKQGYVAMAGLIAHGRGEAFDYLIGEESIPSSLQAARVAAVLLLLAKNPVISVNGNLAALAPKETVELAKLTSSKIEVNLFYRTRERELAIDRVLKNAGAAEVLGIGDSASATIPELHSERRRVDPSGILISDVVLVPMEDGDRTEALRKMRKTVIAIDLNPVSRTSRAASVTIVDNVVRAMPNLTFEANRLRLETKPKLMKMVKEFNNGDNLIECLNHIQRRISKLNENGLSIDFNEDFDT
jgi:4-phosphopantoate--beta-alanine ligase